MRHIFVVSIAIAITASGLASGADDKALVELLARADIADNFTEYCAQFDPSIVQRTSSAVGNTRALALHIRDEVIAGLPFEEARQVVLLSAQLARADALRAVRQLYGANADEERVRLTDWCQRAVEPSVKNFVNIHEGRHEQIDIVITNAKKSH